MPKVIARLFPPAVERLPNIKIQRRNTVYFKRVKIDVFSTANVSLYAVFFSAENINFFTREVISVPFEHLLIVYDNALVVDKALGNPGLRI
jgi:hypothetical protein